MTPEQRKLLLSDPRLVQEVRDRASRRTLPPGHILGVYALFGIVFWKLDIANPLIVVVVGACACLINNYWHYSRSCRDVLRLHNFFERRNRDHSETGE